MRSKLKLLMFVFALSYIQVINTASDSCGSRVMPRHLPDNLHDGEYILQSTIIMVN